MENHTDRRLPGALFWVHGTETEEEYRAAFRRAVEGGVGEITIESRPHSDYLGDKWWADLSMILGWCREEHIDAYIFDEEWFPSGVAGGRVQRQDPAFCNRYLRYEVLNYHGPYGDVTVMPPWTDGNSSGILTAFLYPLTDGKPDYDRAVDVTSRLKKGYSFHGLGIHDAMHIAIPEGEWQLVFQVWSRSDSYIDPLNPDAVAAFMELTYEATRQHLGEYFGNTVKGFFFDEPGYYTPGGLIPWTPDLPQVFREQKGYDPLPYLYALWRQDGPDRFRFDFYEVLNHLYAVRYYQPQQAWCHAHGLRLIGHWFEHENPNRIGERTMLHTDTQHGCGNFFEVSRFGDEGGVDLVCNQVLPGERNRDYYGLPKLASSAAHVWGLEDETAFSETFGAYGYHLGLPAMKWLIDWQAVRGINHFIFHAFNPKPDDTDCPPYYYDDGKNPQWPHFRLFTDYVDRLSALLRGGHHVASVMLLYPGSAAYAGRQASLEDTQRLLQEIQYDYDLVPDGVLADMTVADGTAALRRERYGGVIVSGQEVVSSAAAVFLMRCVANGVPVIFLYRLPVMVADNEALEADFFAAMDGAVCLTDHTALEGALRARGVMPDADFSGSGRDGLRVLHRVTAAGKDIYFINNERVDAAVCGILRVPDAAKLTACDPVTGACFRPELTDEGIALRLEPYTSLLLIADGEATAEIPVIYRDVRGLTRRAVDTAAISCELAGRVLTGTGDWRQIDDTFSGTATYRFPLLSDGGETILDLGEVGDVAEVWVNGAPAGVRICCPYRYDITALLTHGENEITCRVANSDANRFNAERHMGGVGIYITTPSGILGEVAVYTAE